MQFYKTHKKILTLNVCIRIFHRYPDPKFENTLAGERRSVDFIDPDSGEILHQLVQPGMDKIISLNEFSVSGDALLSGMSGSVVLWKKKNNFERDIELEEEEAEKKMDDETKKTNIEGLEVREWPDFVAKEKRKKQTKNEKTKTKSRNQDE